MESREYMELVNNQEYKTNKKNTLGIIDNGGFKEYHWIKFCLFNGNNASHLTETEQFVDGITPVNKQSTNDRSSGKRITGELW